MNRSDKNRFKHFNFLVKFDLLYWIYFLKFSVKFDIVVFNLALANLGKFACQAKFGKLFKFELPILNFINLTAKVSSKFYKLRKHTESKFISKIKNDVAVANTTRLSFQASF